VGLDLSGFLDDEIVQLDKQGGGRVRADDDVMLVVLGFT
jgi:hypothetical protein